MSSHHFVKEGQEPALIIVDALALELAEPLLEWVPLVIVLDNVLEDVKCWGIKIDMVVCSSLDEDQVKDLLSDQFPLQIISGKPEDDPIVTALNFFAASQQPAVNLLMNLSVDRFALLESFPHLNVNVITQTERWLLCRNHFEKWVPAKSILSVRQTNADQELIFEGLTRQDSQVESVNTGTIRIQSPVLFWVGDPL